MTAQTLPDDPNCCFCPAYDIEDEVQQIRIFIAGSGGHVRPARRSPGIAARSRRAHHGEAEPGAAAGGAAQGPARPGRVSGSSGCGLPEDSSGPALLRHQPCHRSNQRRI